ncbi:MAG: nitroreductase family protein [Kineosporiaceae bacterium]
MTVTLADRGTARDVHDLLAERWSPRSFDPDAVLDDATLVRLLEAARWAASAMNAQPWRFLVARRGTEAHARLFATLAGTNQLWAGDASVLVLAVADTQDAEGNPWHYAAYDTGQAVAQLTVQAHADGLAVHQMGGFDRDAVAEAFSLPERLVPQVVVAVGTPSTPERLPDFLAERETAPRQRRELADLLLNPEDLPR